MGYAIIILIILIFAICYAYQMGKYNSELLCLRGFWNSPREFNEEACINIFTAYIGEYSGGKYPIYLLMIDNDDKILINSPTNMYITQTFSNTCSLEKYREFTCKFDDLDSEFMPNNITLKYYYRSGKLVFTGVNHDTIYGCLFKNPVLSEIDFIKDELQTDKPTKKNTNDEISDIA